MGIATRTKSAAWEGKFFEFWNLDALSKQLFKNILCHLFDYKCIIMFFVNKIILELQHGKNVEWMVF